MVDNLQRCAFQDDEELHSLFFKDLMQKEKNIKQANEMIG